MLPKAASLPGQKVLNEATPHYPVLLVAVAVNT